MALIMQIEFAWETLMPRLSTYLKKLTIHFCMCSRSNIFPEGHCFVAVTITRS